MTRDAEHPWHGAAIWAKRTPEGLWIGSPHEVRSGGDVGSVDLWVRTPDGSRLWGVVFSIQGIRDLMESAVESGEFSAPVHYCLHSIVVPRVNEPCIVEAVEALCAAGNLHDAFYLQDQTFDDGSDSDQHQ